MLYSYLYAIYFSRPCVLTLFHATALWLSVLFLRMMILSAENKIQRIKKGIILNSLSEC